MGGRNENTVKNAGALPRTPAGALPLHPTKGQRPFEPIT